MKTLRDPRQPIQEAASETLCKIVSASTSVPVLVRALEASSRDVRKISIEALWKIGTPDAVSGLLKALDDPDWYLRSRAADALGDIGSPKQPWDWLKL